jgi:hypothetical protein
MMILFEVYELERAVEIFKRPFRDAKK